MAAQTTYSGSAPLQAVLHGLQQRLGLHDELLVLHVRLQIGLEQRLLALRYGHEMRLVGAAKDERIRAIGQWRRLVDAVNGSESVD